MQGKSTLSTPEQHQLKVARDTMRLACWAARVMGGMDHVAAASILTYRTGRIVNPPADCNCAARGLFR